jgi:hypothetical protein
VKFSRSTFLFLFALTLAARVHAVVPEASASRPHYYVELELDYRNASYTGRETVRFTNHSRDEWDGVNFALYPNWGLGENDSPPLFFKSAKLGSRELKFNLKARGAWLRIELPKKLLPGQSLELQLQFSARVPKIPLEETGLYAHFLQELSDAASDERQWRDARDVFFASEGALLLGYCFPLLTANQNALNDTNNVTGVSGSFSSEAADYEVHLNTDEALQVIGSGVTAISAGTKLLNLIKISTKWSSFRGERLRGFALVVTDGLKSAEQRVGETRLISYFREKDERLGKRALEFSARALEIYNRSFGAYPYPQLQVVELPLPAGFSSVELPGVVALAQAYYLDFDTAAAARLPGIVREQSDVIKAAFEFSLVHSIAKQWWGGVIGGDAQRSPYIEEGLAGFSAAYYHEAAYGAALGKLITDQQLRGAYQLYRMFGGTDLEVERPAKDFRNVMQYAAIAQAKSALTLVAVREAMGDEQFFRALQAFYAAYQFQFTPAENLRFTFLAQAPDPRAVRNLFQRWWREKHGDEDIGLAESMANDAASASPSKMRAFGRMLQRIGRAARPF